MKKEITVNAPCKINLFLEITGKRQDGYHTIETVMVPVPALSDTVTVSLCPEGISVNTNFDSCKRPADISTLAEKDNIAYKAASVFFEALDTEGISHGGAAVYAGKRIPVRSGLAGGSADAAAVLRGLYTLYNEPFDRRRLFEIALSLGADVPFCLAGIPSLCRGVGEIMTPIDVLRPLHGVITVERDEKKSTGAAYAAADMKKSGDSKSAAETVKALENGDFDSLGLSLYNAFDGALDYGREAEKIIKNAGGKYTVLSGAGPSRVCLAENERDAVKIAAALIREGFFASAF